MNTPLDVLRLRGWCKGEHRDAQGRHCLSGALDRLPHPMLWREVLTEVIAEQFPDRLSRTYDDMYWDGNRPLLTISRFNDHPDTTFVDVEAVVEKAHLRLSERVQ